MNRAMNRNDGNRVDFVKSTLQKMAKIVKKCYGPTSKPYLLGTENGVKFSADGVSVLSSITKNLSQDPDTKLVMRWLLESSMETYRQVGDGTTTTFLLLDYFCNVRGGDERLESEIGAVLAELRGKSLKLNDDGKLLYDIAYISSGDDGISRCLSELYGKFGKGAMVRLREGDADRVVYDSGASYGGRLYSSFFASDKDSGIFEAENPVVICHDGVMRRFSEYEEVVVDAIKEGRPVVFLAGEYDDAFIDMVVKNKSMGFDITLGILNYYGDRRKAVVRDIEFLVEDGCERLVIDRRGISFEGLSRRSDLDEYLASVVSAMGELAEDDDSSRAFYNERLTSLSGKLATVYLRYSNEVDKSYREDLFDDAISAIKSSYVDGYMYGCLRSLSDCPIKAYLEECLSSNGVKVELHDKAECSMSLIASIENAWSISQQVESLAGIIYGD